MSENLLIAKQLYKSYSIGSNKNIIFKDFSLTVARKEILAVTGPSGCGKSTLLQMLGGLDTCDFGTITLEGREITGLSSKELAKLRLKYYGFIFQRFHLLPMLSVLDNIIFPVLAEGKTLNMEEIYALCDTLGLTDHMNQYPHQLSGGEAQRTAIARAIAKKPQIIFADEATGNLDQRNSIQVMELLKKCCMQRQVTLIYVTHDSSLLSYADTVLSLEGK